VSENSANDDLSFLCLPWLVASRLAIKHNQERFSVITQGFFFGYSMLVLCTVARSPKKNLREKIAPLRHAAFKARYLAAESLCTCL
jgi:hypothetical protein